MEARWELAVDLIRSFGVGNITIPAGTRLVSRDSGKTYRFCGREALTILTSEDIATLQKHGIIREVS